MENLKSSTSEEVAVCGAGLAGCMVALLLSNLGMKVSLFEKRNDDQDNLKKGEDGTTSAFGLSASATKRSINLALSYRGMEALRECGLLDQILPHTVPMTGRVIHNTGSSKHITRQQYGTGAEQVLHSVSRQLLNKVLLDTLRAKKDDSQQPLVSIFFGCALKEASVDGTCTFSCENGPDLRKQFSLVIGADGAYSRVREQMLRQGRIDFSRKYIAHGYKELHIPAVINSNGTADYALDDPFGLHIWPRHEFMLIALPNEDKSFTATLFAPHGGNGGFDDLKNADSSHIRSHFLTHFNDVVGLMPSLVEDFKANPVGALVTVRVKPWNLGRLLLLGDAAHAVVPFLGQGMNAAFEDALLLYELISSDLNSGTKPNWVTLAQRFSDTREPSLGGLASLCIEHYDDMAASTASLWYLGIKWVEQWVHRIFPRLFLPEYTMITFTRIPYHVARDRAKVQDKFLKFSVIGITSLLTSVAWMKIYHKFV